MCSRSIRRWWDLVSVIRKGKVRRAKLYYLRGRRGKSARISERAENAGPGDTASWVPRKNGAFLNLSPKKRQKAPIFRGFFAFPPLVCAENAVKSASLLIR